MHIWTSWCVLVCPVVSWGIKTDWTCEGLFQWQLVPNPKAKPCKLVQSVALLIQAFEFDPSPAHTFKEKFNGLAHQV